MKKDFLLFKTAAPALMLVVLFLVAYVHASGIKTSYKQYSVFTYENEDILCEPYQVKKDDWLYKIFRKKGEISEADFPRFLNIFKKINPRINNIDSIAPGINILIPLKKIDKQTYEQKKPGIVEVPVVEFSSIPDRFDIRPFIREKTIQAGDTVSTLLSSQFLEKDGSLSQEGQKAFSHLNPNIKNIDMIYQGAQLVIPDPSILSQPWFESFLKQGSASLRSMDQTPVETSSHSLLPVISPQQMAQLKRYAALIQGTLINQGQMYFPGKEAQANLVLDLVQTPLIESKDGQKTLIVPSDDNGSSLGNELVKNIKAYWKQIKIQEIDMAISIAQELGKNKNSMADRVIGPSKFISKLLSITQYPYTPENISFSVESIEMSASFGHITRQGEPDLLINAGSVYGLALETLEEKGNHILTISPGLTMSELILTLFTRLGYSTWKNPSFTTSGRVESIKGIYVAKDKEKLFFTRQKPNSTAISFLETENIQFLILNQ